jgi:hypothetical protein
MCFFSLTVGLFRFFGNMLLTDIGVRDVESHDQYPLEKLNPYEYFGDKNKGFASTR